MRFARLGFFAVVAIVGCNSLTGVDDLSFDVNDGGAGGAGAGGAPLVAAGAGGAPIVAQGGAPAAAGTGGAAVIPPPPPAAGSGGAPPTMSTTKPPAGGAPGMAGAAGAPVTGNCAKLPGGPNACAVCCGITYPGAQGTASGAVASCGCSGQSNPCANDCKDICSHKPGNPNADKCDACVVTSDQACFAAQCTGACASYAACLGTCH